MSLNPYFNNFAYEREQHLIESLIIESIKMYGYPIKYIPRTIVRNDTLFGEDTLSIFDDAIEIEVYIKSVDGFEGEGEFLSKFNIEIRDQVTFTMARKRFDQARSEKLTTENGYNLILETGDNKTPSRQFLSTAHEGHSIVLEEGTGMGYSITSNRPTEGDLIYLPLAKKLFQIKFVDHDAVFYQMGRLQTYDIRCELFEYSSERIDTGDAEIDAIEDAYSFDITNQQILDEDGFGVLLESGGFILQEYVITDIDSLAINDYVESGKDTVFTPSDIIDFSESNPFGEVDRF